MNDLRVTKNLIKQASCYCRIFDSTFLCSRNSLKGDDNPRLIDVNDAAGNPLSEMYPKRTYAYMVHAVLGNLEEITIPIQ
jgi:hypothetical protein